MPKQCVVGGCTNREKDGFSLFCFPKDQDVAHKWDAFVKKDRVDWNRGTGTKHDPICALHFTLDSFTNHFAWQVRHQKCLYLEKGSVPSISVRNIGENHRLMLRNPEWQPPKEVPGILRIFCSICF